MSETPHAALGSAEPVIASDLAVVDEAHVAPQVEGNQESQLSPPTARVEREETEATDIGVAEEIPSTPQAALTFLLVSGRRRTMVFEPETAIGRVKELVWNTWPTDWQDERPPAPSYLRVLYLGKMLQDDETLTTLKLPTHTPAADRAPPTNPPPTIVHLSIRVYPPTNSPEGKKKKKRTNAAVDRDGPGANEASQRGTGGGCGCIIC